MAAKLIIKQANDVVCEVNEVRQGYLVANAKHAKKCLLKELIYNGECS